MKRKRKNQGIITVFVLLIMVPTVVITGTVVDLARLKMCNSQAAMAADSYGEVVLSSYDNLLKELYGLFAVTQTEEGIKEIEELAKHTGYSFSPDGGDLALGDAFMPYKSSEAKITYEAVANATLNNNNILMTQISDFMKFRIVEEILGETNILTALEGFEKLEADMDVVEERNDITTDSMEVLGKIDEYYQVLKALDQYPSYIKQRETKYKDYSTLLKDVFESDEYNAYVYYLDNKTAIDTAKAKIDAYEAYLEAVDDAEGEEKISEVSAPTEIEITLAGKYIDINAYKETLNTTFLGWPENANNNTEVLSIKFGDVEDKINDLEKLSNKIEGTLQDLDEKLDSLRSKLLECSADMRAGVEEEIKDLEKVAQLAGEFNYITNLLTTLHNLTEQDKQNKTHWDTELKELENVQNALLNGTKKEKDWKNTIQFQWFSFREDNRAKETYEVMIEMCEGKGGAEGDKEAADREIKKADSVKAEAENALKGDETTEARNIGSLAPQLKGVTNTGEVPDMWDCLSGGASLKSLGNGAIGKFLTVTYDFGMFSSRVSGIEPPKVEGDKDDSEGTPIEVLETESEPYFDESLTGVKMSKAVNYLYGAEIEYLIGGHNDSVKNLNHTRNIICGTRLSLNYVSTYSIDAIDKAIKGIATAAEAAITATGVGAAAGPLVRVAVSGALRAAVATLETAADWRELKNREDVFFYKRKLDDLTMDISNLTESLGLDLTKGSSGGADIDDKLEFKLSYEDYTYIVMCLFVDTNNLLDRTSNLITLNVNQSQNTDPNGTLSNLSFNMEKTVTAVKSTCEVKFDFVIVPDNFMNLFIPEGSTRDTMQKLEDGSYAYTMIRGY